MSLKDLEAKLSALEVEKEELSECFGECSKVSFDVIEESPFKLDMELAGGSRPRTC